jgi:hypothetical protein
MCHRRLPAHDHQVARARLSCYPSVIAGFTGTAIAGFASLQSPGLPARRRWVLTARDRRVRPGS